MYKSYNIRPGNYHPEYCYEEVLCLKKNIISLDGAERIATRFCRILRGLPLPISISEHIKITPEEFAKTGAFDAVLDVDSKLFIDPHLLRSTSAPELSKSYQTLSKRFTDILHLLSASKYKGDAFWRKALQQFTFPELRGLCIGYSSKGTLGSGMGLKLRTQIIGTAKEIVDAGIKDPELFELIGLFEDDIGPDRISDMVGRIIIDDLRRYTHRIFTELKVKTTPIQNTSYTSANYRTKV